MRNKTIFSFLYNRIFWFIIFFVLQINALDTIKNIFKESKEALRKTTSVISDTTDKISDQISNTVKKGYNWLRGNQSNKKIEKSTPAPQDTENKPEAIQEKIPENKKDPIDDFFKIIEHKINNTKSKHLDYTKMLLDKTIQKKMIDNYIKKLEKKNIHSTDEIATIEKQLSDEMLNENVNNKFKKITQKIDRKKKITAFLKNKKNKIANKSENTEITQTPESAASPFEYKNTAEAIPTPTPLANKNETTTTESIELTQKNSSAEPIQKENNAPVETNIILNLNLLPKEKKIVETETPSDDPVIDIETPLSKENKEEKLTIQKSTGLDPITIEDNQ
jgi:hypothetical protein